MVPAPDTGSVIRKRSVIEKSRSTALTADQRCHICHAQATGFHFEAQSCSACAAFFRRTISLTKTFKCINGMDACQVHYSMHQICRACRLEACVKAGMDRGSVQPRRGADAQKRTFITKSGLRRNKRFAVGVVPVDDEEQEQAAQILSLTPNASLEQSPKAEPDPDFKTGTFDYTPSGRSRRLAAATPTDEDVIRRKMSRVSVISPAQTASPITLSPGEPRSGTSSRLDMTPVKKEEMDEDATMTPSPSMTPVSTSFVDQPNALEILIKEEQRLGERRRICFCNRPIGQMLGANRNCPFTREDIKPLSFRSFRKQIRTHILFIYEWLQTWPDYALMIDKDRVSVLRSCVLLHTILDPIYITLQIGLPDRFVMQNGGYLSCLEGGTEGWGSEGQEINEATKRRIYEPLMRKIMSEIIPPMVGLNLSFEEFVALKAIMSFQGAVHNLTSDGKVILRRQLNAVFASFHQHLIEKGSDPATRMGEIMLLLSGIFTTGLEFVESHRQIEFFDLWQLDSLLSQLLNLEKIWEVGARTK